MFLTVFPPFYTQEQIASITLHSFLKSDGRDLLSLLIKYKRVTTLFHEQIALSLTKNELFARKTNEWIPNPAKNKDFFCFSNTLRMKVFGSNTLTSS